MNARNSQKDRVDSERLKLNRQRYTDSFDSLTSVMILEVRWLRRFSLDVLVTCDKDYAYVASSTYPDHEIWRL